MTKAKTGWLLLGILSLASFAVADDTAWAKYSEAGRKAYRSGQYAEAEKLLLVALKEAEKFGELDGRLIYSLNDLAELYRAQGKYAEAEPLFKRALANQEKVLGPKHRKVAPSLNGLALLYQAQGKYAEAEPFFRRVLAILEKALGPEHPDVATTLENYAVLLRKTNRDAEAAKMEARAKTIRAKHAAKNPKK